MGNILHIYTTGRHIGGHHDSGFPFFKSFQGIQACILRFVGMNNTQFVFPEIRQLINNTVGIFLGLGENHHFPEDLLVCQQQFQEIDFSHYIRHLIAALLYRVDRRSLGSHFHPFRIQHKLLCQTGYCFRKSGRKQQSLVFFRYHFENTPQLRNET